MFRGICEMIVLLDHTEVYYSGDRITNYNFYSSNALVVFFFLSGYLTYKATGFDLKKKMKSLFKCILLPYFIFTSVLAFPKALVHGSEMGVADALCAVAGGQASWFVAALFVADLIFFTAIRAARGSNAVLTAVAVVCFGGSIWLSTVSHPNYWQLENGLQGVLFLYMGHMYHKYEPFFNRFNTWQFNVLLFLSLILVKTYVYVNGVNMLICPVNITSYPVFLIDITVFLLFFVNVFKALPECRWLGWTGSHTIVYYFFCGAVPMAVSMLFNRMGFPYQGGYLSVGATALSFKIL